MLHLCTPLYLKELRLHMARIFTFIVALQIMNMGLFVQDFKPLASFHYDVNIINTVEEYIAEVVLGHKNALPENNDHQKKDFSSHKHITYKIINISRPALTFSSKVISDLWTSVYLQNYNYEFWEDINPPPPKFIV